VTAKYSRVGGRPSPQVPRDPGRLGRRAQRPPPKSGVWFAADAGIDKMTVGEQVPESKSFASGK
jgi:hypothetical protein